MAPTEKRAWLMIGIFVVAFPVWLALALTAPGIDEANVRCPALATITLGSHKRGH